MFTPNLCLMLVLAHKQQSSRIVMPYGSSSLLSADTSADTLLTSLKVLQNRHIPLCSSLVVVVVFPIN